MFIRFSLLMFKLSYIMETKFESELLSKRKMIDVNTNRDKKADKNRIKAKRKEKQLAYMKYKMCQICAQFFISPTKIYHQLANNFR